MAKQTINIGTADKGDGDPIRTAFNKVNANFTELYTALGLNSGGLNIGSFEFTDNIITTTDSSNVIIDQAVTITSELTVQGDIVPNIANEHTLGTPAKPFKSLYVSNSTIFLGGVPLSLEPGTNELKVNNVPVSQTITYTDIPDVPTDISDLTDTEGLLGGGNADTGDVTFNGVKIIGAGTASGDGNSFSTLELVPDNSLYNNHQYLVIDPTFPSHIHIRAGGPQDNSNADLFLGGEKSYVRVRNSSVRMQTETQQSTGYFNFNTSVGFSSAAWQDDGFGGYQIIVNTPTPDVFTAVWGLTTISFIQVYDGTNYTTVTANGNSGTPGGGPITFGVVEAPPSSPTAIVEIIIENFVLRTNSAEVNGSDFTVNVYDDVRLTGSDVVSIRNRSTSAPITIITDWDDDEFTWSFNSDGTLNFPDGSVQTTAFTGSSPESDTLDSVTDRGATTTNNITVGGVITSDITNKVSPAVGGQVTGVRYWDGAGVNLYVWIDANATPEIVTLNSFGDITGWTVSVSDGNSATVTATNPGGYFSIGTDQPLTGTGTLTFTSPDYAPSTPLPVDINVDTNTWTFGTDGDLTLPGNIITPQQASISTSSGLGIDFDGVNTPNTIDIGELGTWNYVRLQFHTDTVTGNEGDVEFQSPPMGVGPASSIVLSPQGGQNGSYVFGGGGNLTLPGGGSINGADYDIEIVAGNDGASTFGSVTINTQAPASTYTVTQEGGSPGGPGGATISGGAVNSPAFALITVGMTVTGPNLVGVTTVTNVTGPDEYGTYIITTDADEFLPFDYNAVYTFTSAGGVTNRNWEFNSLGEFYLPQGGAIQETTVTNELWGGTTTALTLVPGGAANGQQRLEIYSTGGGEGDHIHITSGDQTQTDLFLGNDTQYFAVAASGANYIQARPGAASPSPGISAGPGANVNIYAGNAGDNGGNVSDGNSGGDVFIASGISTSGLGGDILINTSSGPDGFGSIELSTDGGSSVWTFNKDNQLVFPDNTIQTTAWTGAITKTIQSVAVTTPTAITADVVFGDPNAAGGAVNLVLPASPVNGTVVTVKNINAGGNPVYVSTNGVLNMETEAGTIGSGVYATIAATGDFITWIYQSSTTTYRIIG